jgi:hypothetical protein
MLKLTVAIGDQLGKILNLQAENQTCVRICKRRVACFNDFQRLHGVARQNRVFDRL